MAETNGRPRVLILGGGFAGVGAANELRKSDVDVVIVTPGKIPQHIPNAFDAGR